MTALEAVQTVQFVTVRKKRFAIIDAEEWQALVEWLETLEDLQIFKESYEALAQAGGDRQQAGWLPWLDVSDEIA
jgi:PHD/YefM family antitoxin component YafN of YafNO toxin-antitoxin module